MYFQFHLVISSILWCTPVHRWANVSLRRQMESKYDMYDMRCSCVVFTWLCTVTMNMRHRFGSIFSHFWISLRSLCAPAIVTCTGSSRVSTLIVWLTSVIWNWICPEMEKVTPGLWMGECKVKIKPCGDWAVMNGNYGLTVGFLFYQSWDSSSLNTSTSEGEIISLIYLVGLVLCGTTLRLTSEGGIQCEYRIYKSNEWTSYRQVHGVRRSWTEAS